MSPPLDASWRVQTRADPTQSLLLKFCGVSGELVFTEGSGTGRLRLDYLNQAPMF